MDIAIASFNISLQLCDPHDSSEHACANSHVYTHSDCHTSTHGYSYATA